MDRRLFTRSFAALPFAAGAFSSMQGQTDRRSREAVTTARTFSQVGKELRPFAEHQEATLAEQQGAGYLDHMWFGGDFKDFKRLRLRFYIDGETAPSIDAELGLAVGVGFQEPVAPWGTEWAGITGAPSGVYLNFRIPFGKSIRVTAELPPGVSRDTVFWWIARGLLDYPLEVSGMRLPENTRLRLYRNDLLHVEPLGFFDLAKVHGSGVVFQVTMAAQSTNFEFMEGQMRAFIGGVPEPMMLSSGLEDYFLGTYYFNRGLYHLPMAGLTHKDDATHTFSGYRYHDQDPVFYAGGLRLVCRCGEMLGTKIAGPTGKPQPTDYTTYTWLYQW